MLLELVAICFLLYTHHMYTIWHVFGEINKLIKSTDCINVWVWIYFVVKMKWNLVFGMRFYMYIHFWENSFLFYIVIAVFVWVFCLFVFVLCYFSHERYEMFCLKRRGQANKWNNLSTIVDYIITFDIY
jgi:hypothetical protein